MKHTPRITLHMGAAHNTITVDGQVIDRSTLIKGMDRKVRGIVLGALQKDGYFDR